MLQTLGRRGLEEAYDALLDLAASTAEACEARPELELYAPPPLTTVVFRHRRGDNDAIRRALQAEGRAVIARTRIDGEVWLKLTLLNPEVTGMDAVLDAVVEKGERNSRLVTRRGVTDTLLLVEDDAALRTFLADNLTADGFEMLVAGTVRDGLRALDAHAPGARHRRRRAARRLRPRPHRPRPRADRRFARTDPDQRFLVLSGRGAELDRVRGLQRGADDYLVKPFSYPELLLRVRALLRRGGGAAGRARGGCGSARSSSTRRRATSACAASGVELSAKEFALLRALAADPTRVFTKEELLRDVWGFASRRHRRGRWTRTPAGCGASSASRGDRFVVNVWGVGYRLIDAVPA